MFKDRLRDLRKEYGLTQEELGKKIFVSRSTICKWEIGNGLPSDANLESLCELFNVSKEWLLDLEDYKEYVNNEIKKSKLSTVILLLVFSFVSGFISISLLAILSYYNNYHEIGEHALWVFPILLSFPIPIILVLIARRINYKQNVLIGTKIFVLIILSIFATLCAFALKLDNSMNKHYVNHVTYSKDKWAVASNEYREELLDSFLNEYNLCDFDKSDVTYYLSAPSKRSDNTFTYYLGSNNEFNQKKSLIILFNEQDEVESYYILCEEVSYE